MTKRINIFLFSFFVCMVGMGAYQGMKAADLSNVKTLAIGKSSVAVTGASFEVAPTSDGKISMPCPPYVSTSSVSVSVEGGCIYDSAGKKWKLYNGTAWGDVGSSGAGGLYAGGQNLVTNNSWESDTSSWTTTGGIYTRSTASGTFIPPGVGGAAWDASALGQILYSTGATVNNNDGISTRDIVGSIATRCAGGANTCGHVLEIYNSSTAITLSSVAITSSSVGWSRTSINGVAPSNGVLQLRVRSGSDEPIVYADDAFLGLAEGFNTLNISQATLAGQSYIAGTTNCDWAVTNTAFTDFTADTDCPGPTLGTTNIGAWQTTDADLPQQTINNLPPGVYEVKFTGNTYIATSEQAAAIRISDGTTTSPGCPADTATGSAKPAVCIGVFVYTTAANRTFKIQGKSAANAFHIFNSTNGAEPTFTVTRYPLSSEQAYRPDTLTNSWSGYHDNTCSWARTNTAYGDPTADASCVLTERLNRNFGSVVTSGSALPGITFTPVKAQRYFICAQPKVSSATLAATIDLRLWDGTTTIVEAESSNFVANNFIWSPMCGIYSAASISPVTISLQSRITSGSVAIAANSTNASAVEWSLFGIDQSLPAPALVNSVVNTSSGITRVESAKLNCDASATITSQHGSWVASIGNAASGSCAVTLTSGIFAGSPYCAANVDACNGGCVVAIGSQTATSMQVYCMTDTGGAGTSCDPRITCVGPR